MRKSAPAGMYDVSRELGSVRLPDPAERLAALAGSKFRARQRLGTKERAYLARKSLDSVLVHARDFIQQRLAPAEPGNDGRQTPMRGHPVFVAQHATATCCRGCLAKWHGIPSGRALTSAEIDYIVSMLGIWLRAQSIDRLPADPLPLFPDEPATNP